jgi:hypothetical protein
LEETYHFWQWKKQSSEVNNKDIKLLFLENEIEAQEWL